MKWIEVDEIRRKVSRSEKPIDEETRAAILRLCDEYAARPETPEEGEGAALGFIILWDGQACDIGALDGTLGVSVDEAGLFRTREQAQKAIDDKVASYKAYAVAFPKQTWPTPGAGSFQIVAVLAPAPLSVSA